MDGIKKILNDIETNVYHSSQQKTADWLESILKKYNIKIKPKMDRKLIESHFKLFRKVIQLQNFHKDIKEKGASKAVINLKELDDIINEAREINKHYSEFPESEKLRLQVKVFSREECIWKYCPYGEETCREKCAHN